MNRCTAARQLGTQIKKPLSSSQLSFVPLIASEPTRVRETQQQQKRNNITNNSPSEQRSLCEEVAKP